MGIDVSKINNSAIEERLLEKGNLDALEHLIVSNNLYKMGDVDALDFIIEGPEKKLTDEELAELYPQVAERVDSFLGISEADRIKLPKCSYFTPFDVFWYKKGGAILAPLLGGLAGNWGVQAVINLSKGISEGTPEYIITGSIQALNVVLFSRWTIKEIEGHIHNSNYMMSPYYIPGFKRIKLLKEDETEILSTIGHEYSHHIQQMKLGRKIDNTNCFKEGHARGVERHIAGEYAIERRDLRVWRHPYFSTQRELIATFGWMCDKHNFSGRKELFKENGNRFGFALDYLKDKVISSDHAIGNTIFYLAEQKHGTGIYASALRGDVNFLDDLN